MLNRNNIRSLVKNGVVIFNLNGPNSAGKGKKGRILEILLKQAYPHIGVARIVMSDLIKQHRANQTTLGQQFLASQFLEERGELVPDEPVFAALDEELSLQFNLGNRLLLLDGFPRNCNQAKPFLGADWFMVFHINVSLETSLARAKQRWDDAVSIGKAPREDDKPEVVTYRYRQIYEGRTLKAIKMIRNTRTPSVINVPGDQPVRNQIARMVKEMPMFVRVHDRTRVLAPLDNPAHEATKIMVEMEKPRSQSVGIHHQREHSSNRGLTAAKGAYA